MMFCGGEPGIEPGLKDKRKDLAIGKIQECSRFPGIAVAAATGHLNLATAHFSAAVGEARLLIGFLHGFLLTAAGVVGPLSGRTSAAGAVSGNLTTRGIGVLRDREGGGRERTHDYGQIDHREQQGG